MHSNNFQNPPLFQGLQFFTRFEHQNSIKMASCGLTAHSPSVQAEIETTIALCTLFQIHLHTEGDYKFTYTYCRPLYKNVPLIIARCTKKTYSLLLYNFGYIGCNNIALGYPMGV